MFSHVFLGISDFERALAFYDPLMAALGFEPRFRDPERPWAGWHGPGGGRPLLLIGRPYDRAPHQPGNGQMVALLAGSRDAVTLAHRVALAHGGRCEGPPGWRPEYHAGYFGAYFRDPDGNKLAVACHG